MSHLKQIFLLVALIAFSAAAPLWRNIEDRGLDRREFVHPSAQKPTTIQPTIWRDPVNRPGSSGTDSLAPGSRRESWMVDVKDLPPDPTGKFKASNIMGAGSNHMSAGSLPPITISGQGYTPPPQAKSSSSGSSVRSKVMGVWGRVRGKSG